MLAPPERSQLQVQMGQEVIYLLLASSMLGCIVLAAYVLLNMKSAQDLQKEVEQLTVTLEQQIEAARISDEPPIILLPEAEGYTFEMGSGRSPRPSLQA